MKKILLIGIVLFGFVGVKAQTNLATWNFDTEYPTTIATVYPATSGTGTIYLDGTNGSSSWLQTELDNYGGSTKLDTRTTPDATFALSIKNKTANDKQVIIKLSTINYINPFITFTTAGSATGFTTHQWAYSIDGTTFTDFGTNTVENTSTYVNKSLDMTAIDAVDNIPNLYIRLTLSGASGTGNNKIDNLSITGTSTLPISLTSFTAKPVDKSILLSWTTASEKNNQKFEVLRSVDGKDFKVIGTVDGAGNSNAELSYSFVDENPYAGTNYYQLKQTDLDGATEISTVISAKANIESVKLSVYSSPSSVTVNINSPNQTDGEVALFDMNGRKLDVQNLVLNRGYNEIKFDKSLTPGTYFVNLVSAGKSTSFKFMR